MCLFHASLTQFYICRWKMRTWLVWAFLIDKYVTVHLNENDPNKNTYSIHKHCRFRRTTRDNFEKSRKTNGIERNTSSCHTKWTPNRNKLRSAHNANSHTIQKCHWKRWSLWILASFFDFSFIQRAYLYWTSNLLSHSILMFSLCAVFFSWKRRE